MPSSLTGGAGIEQARGTGRRGQMGETYRPSQAIVMTLTLTFTWSEMGNLGWGVNDEC